MKITTIDRQTIREMRPIIENALNNIELDGVEIRMGSGSFSPNNVTFKVEVALKNSNGMANTKAAMDWKTHASYFGLPKNGLGKTVEIHGEMVKIVGLKPRSRKFPVLGERQDGKVFKYPSSVVSIALEVGRI